MSLICIGVFLSTFFIFSPSSIANRGRRTSYDVVTKLAERGNIDPIKQVYLNMMIDRIREDNPDFDFTFNSDFDLHSAINKIHQRFLNIEPRENDPLLIQQETVPVHEYATLHQNIQHSYTRSFGISSFRAQVIVAVLMDKVGTENVSENMKNDLIEMIQTPTYQSKIGLSLLKLARTALDYDISHEPEEAMAQYFPIFYSPYFRKFVLHPRDFIKMMQFTNNIKDVKPEKIDNKNPSTANVLLELAENLHKIRTLDLTKRIQVMNIMDTLNEKLNTKITQEDVELLPYLRMDDVDNIMGIDAALDIALLRHIIKEEAIVEDGFVASLRKAKQTIHEYFKFDFDYLEEPYHTSESQRPQLSMF